MKEFNKYLLEKEKELINSLGDKHKGSVYNMKNFKNLTQVKKQLQVGDLVMITNMIYGTKDKRKITKMQTNGIYTLAKNFKRTVFDNNTKKLVEKIEDREVFLDWQKASETRIENNKIYFLKNEYMLEKHIEDIDYWLILEIL